jgi:hypothetical protein
LNKTLFYRTERYDINPDWPTIVTKDILIGDIPAMLTSILEDNGDNRAVFEYLMAFYLLERDFEQAKKCYDRYFPSFPYRHIPVHYAEFLVLYKHINKLDDSFYEHYPVPRNIRERFDMMDVLVQAKMDGQVQKSLENSFGNTYWFYVRFPLFNIQTVKKNERYIY